MRTDSFKKYNYRSALALVVMLTAIVGFNNGYDRQLKNPINIPLPGVQANAHKASNLIPESSYLKPDTSTWPNSFGIGRAVTLSEIAVLNISVSPDGRGLPAGSGNVASGKSIYEVKCIACHGKNGYGGPYSPLVGAMGDTTKAKTIGNYWPYATTLFDYIRRAMPFNQPGSLNNNEVYSLTAYLLYKNKITDEATTLNAVNLPKIKMPALPLFVNDDRHGGPEIK